MKEGFNKEGLMREKKAERGKLGMNSKQLKKKLKDKKDSQLKKLPKLRLEKSFISMKSLKKSDEIRDFYKLVFNYNLREESFEIFDKIISSRKKKNQK